ncbi:hypothetical protein [Bremerella sp. P1]|uniref:hypothetical protein n=1 Tax=Bremerella sp. P1 TaxID=3026424 RepID=UPI002367C446|nr:hypothetical protein [Bremerella sp. P1]WDI43511.1 hypothetical protein PSR63_06070 [Bremerella sp. P1]
MLTALLRPILNLGGFAVLALGLAAAYFGFINSSIYVGGSSTPARISIEELGKSGSISNNHVTITDFDYPFSYLVSRTYEEAWIPIQIDAGKSRPESTERPVILYVDNASEDAVAPPDAKVHPSQYNRVDEVLDRPELTGILSYGIVGDDGSQPEEFAKMFRGTSLDEAITLEIDKPFPGFFASIPCFLAGILLVVASGVMWFFGSKL